jgi:hypothetical protein
MSESEFNKLKETSWRRKLTPREEAALADFLAGHLEERLGWETELRLNQMLNGLPDAPVSSNFTSQVLQAVEQDVLKTSRGSTRKSLAHWFRFNWLPRIAIATFLFGGGILSLQQYKRVQVAHDVAAVSSVAAIPPQWLQDFDAINRLSQPPIDDELLAALQ